MDMMCSFVVPLLAHKLDKAGLKPQDISVMGVAKMLYDEGIRELEDLAGVSTARMCLNMTPRDKETLQVARFFTLPHWYL